ncbi:MAG: hypothetical protein JXQ73_00190 [Phycisphaerae bacterium]|nr:hypothetical protein [Phycisphaerae bacterium]
MVQLGERDRAFGMLDERYDPILESLKKLDASRDRLIKALDDSNHADLAAMLRQKRLTSAPGFIEIICGEPKNLDFTSDGKTAVIKVSVPMPDGKTQQAWVRLSSEGVGWRVALPFAQSADAEPKGVPVGELQSEVDKAVADLQKAMDDFSGRLEAGQMIETGVIRDKLTACGRPIAAVMQRLIYNQTNIK